MLTTAIVYSLIIQLAISDSNSLDDRELALLIKRGDKTAFKKFFDTHHKPLFLFLVKKGVSEQTAEDLIQQAFVLIWEKRDDINPEKSLRSFLFRIAYTRMLNHIRDHAKFSEAEVSDFEQPNEETDQAETKELGVHIENAISAMPEKRQAVFRLCFIQEFTYKEAAEILEVSVKTIENHMGLALKELRTSLAKFI